MTKEELIEQMAVDAGISKTEASNALKSLIDGITQGITGNDGKVTITGFGTFSRAHRNARKGVNPATGQEITIKAHNVVKFSAGKALKDALA